MCMYNNHITLTHTHIKHITYIFIPIISHIHIPIMQHIHMYKPTTFHTKTHTHQSYCAHASVSGWKGTGPRSSSVELKSAVKLTEYLRHAST